MDTTSSPNPAPAAIVDFFNDYPTLKKAILKAVDLSKNGPSAGRKLLAEPEAGLELSSDPTRKLLCSSSCKVCVSSGGSQSCTCVC